MKIAVGVSGALAGTVLFLWYHAVVALPLARRPAYVRPVLFKWGVPGLSLLLFASGLLFLNAANPLLGAVVLAVLLLGGYLVIRFDAYTAEMRLIFDRYRRVRQANPAMEEMEILFHTAAWRYPAWSQDRLVELVAGKDIQGLMLLMMVNENRISPLSDWELYRSLKSKAARIAVSNVREKVTNMLAVSLFSILLFGAHQGVAQTATPESATPPRPDLPGYLEVTPRIGTGGQPTDDGIRQLAEKGYRTIVNMREPGEEGLDFDKERNLAEDLGMKYYQIAFSSKEPKEEPVSQLITLMEQLKQEKVFVHCRTGSRVGAAMMCKRALKDGVPAERAEEEAGRIGLRSEALRQFAREYIANHKADVP